MYDFSVALISALALLKNTNFSVLKIDWSPAHVAVQPRIFTDSVGPVLRHYILLFYTGFCSRLGLQTIDSGLVSGTKSAQV